MSCEAVLNVILFAFISYQSVVFANGGDFAAPKSPCAYHSQPIQLAPSELLKRGGAQFLIVKVPADLVGAIVLRHELPALDELDRIQKANTRVVEIVTLMKNLSNVDRQNLYAGPTAYSSGLEPNSQALFVFDLELANHLKAKITYPTSQQDRPMSTKLGLGWPENHYQVDVERLKIHLFEKDVLDFKFLREIWVPRNWDLSLLALFHYSGVVRIQNEEWGQLIRHRSGFEDWSHVRTLQPLDPKTKHATTQGIWWTPRE